MEALVETSNTASEIPSNIIQFPKDKIVRLHKQPKTSEEFNEKLAEHKVNFVDYVLLKNMTMLCNHLSMDGVDVDTDTFMKDYSFVCEILKASIYRTIALPHPMHDFITANVELMTEGMEIVPDEFDDDEENDDGPSAS